jgi:hypothetical protein
MSRVGAGKPWYDHATGSLPRVGEFLTALLAAVALASLIRSIYRRTLGRRRDRYARLQRLGTNAQLSFFDSVLGEPAAMRRTVEGFVTRYNDDGRPSRETKDYIECVWIDRDYYVQAVADSDETIHAYSVTTRRKGFRPRFRPPGGTAVERHWPLRRLLGDYKFQPNKETVLGRTKFAELGNPGSSACWVGAHNLHYFESYYLGNPGHYQTFVYGVNDAGAWAWDLPLGDDFYMHNFSWGFGADDPDFETMDRWQPFRRSARINTYTVLSPELALNDYPFAGDPPNDYPTIFGANSGRVRTLTRDG